MFSTTLGNATLDLVSGGAHAVEVLGSRVSGRARSDSVLRVEVVILSGPDGPLCREDATAPALERADEILRAHAGIRVRVTGVRTVSELAPDVALDPRADRALLLDDMLGRTEFYRKHCAAPPVPTVASPVTVVVVRSIAGHATGCSLGISADWVIVEASLFDTDDHSRYDETVLVHELGHNLNLPHHRYPGNLMYPVSSPPGHVRGTGLTGWQAAVLQSSRRVVPGAAPASL